MSDEKTGGYAFPAIGESNTPGGTRYVFNEGMTMLDHFAGLAMQALIAKAPWYEVYNDQEEKTVRTKIAALSSGAYAYAAAMIAERNRLMNEKP